jgi:hypothetical protein
MKSQAVLFNKQLSKKLYNVDQILSLTYKEILQDIYNNPGIPDSTLISLNQTIQNQISKYSSDKAKKIINLQDPTQRSSSLPLPTNPVSIPNYKKFCKNNVNTTIEWDIVYYNDQGTLYCFNLLPLLVQFKNNNYINPETGKRFNKEFISHMEKISYDQVEKELFDELFLDNEETYEKIPSISSQVFLDLKSRENKLLLDKHKACSYYEKYIKPNSSLERKIDRSDEELNKFKQMCE